MRRIGVLAAALVAVFTAAGRPSAADIKMSDDPMDNVTIGVPSFNVRLAMGFNYDLLRPMTGVSFLYPAGYLGFNVPVGYSAGLGDFLSDETMDDLFSNGKVFKKGERFKPSAGAEQNANYSVRVDVPMLAGVGTFAYTQNFFMNFSTALGGSSVIETLQPVNAVLDPDENGGREGSVAGFTSIRGALRLPLSFSVGWETMTFGYAYRVGRSDDLVFALNMHRHLFSADIRLKADIDLLGYASINAKDIYMENGAYMNLPIEEELINFSSDRCNGFAQGHFKAEGWSPAVGVKWKRFAINSRFGLNIKAAGSAGGGFVVPRVVSLETGDLILGEKFKQFSDSLNTNPLSMFSMLESGGIIPTEIDSISYEISSFQWKMPQGHTLSFDIIPQRLAVSYTKLFGEIGVQMDVLRKVSQGVKKTDSLGNSDTSFYFGNPRYDRQQVDVGILVDHILVFSATYPSFFANVGVAGFDIRNKDTRVLRDNNSLKSLRVGDVVMLLPILNGGFNLGTKLQLHIEADILPLPALRSGVNYYF